MEFINSHEEVRIGAHLVTNLTKISEGGFGLIFSANDKHTQQQYVVKKCSVNRQETFDVVKKEVMVLDKFKDCPYVVTMLGSNVSGGPDAVAYILLEMCPGGHMLDRINQLDQTGQVLEPQKMCTIFGQILSAIKVMHETRPRAFVRDNYARDGYVYVYV